MFPKITTVRLIFATLIVFCVSVAMTCYFYSMPEQNWLVVSSPLVIIPGLFALLTWVSIIRRWTEWSSSEKEGPTHIFTTADAVHDERQRMMSHPYGRRNLSGHLATGNTRE